MCNDQLARPTRQQLRWQDFEVGMFCHFGMNTFCDQEWGEGKDIPAKFNPAALDAQQWVKTAVSLGAGYFMVTAKHHDGFCLWQTSTTEYSVKSSSWKGGKGDVLEECAQACRKEGIPFGIYLSPWDRHEPCYLDKEAYDDFYAQQLTELLSGYGPLAEIWFDGAGSEGREYDWPRFMDIVQKYQPDAMVFNMGRPTIRWVGNEEGTAPYPCWNTASEARVSMFTKDMLTWLPDTPSWVPAECDVPIHKKHWFWHPEDGGTLLSLEELMHIYYSSVGHGANLLLNIAPDNRGLISEEDVKRTEQFGSEIRKRFSKPLAQFSGQGRCLTLDLLRVTAVNHAVLMEEIAEGERIREYILEAELMGKWVKLVHGSAIGHKKIDLFDTVETDKIRLTVLESADIPLIRNFAVYYV